MQDSEQKTVLITGAGSGIGLDLVHTLVNEFQVIATVRKDADHDRLRQTYGKRVHVIKMDVTDAAAVAALPAQLEKEFGVRRLFGLVNNAGIAMAGPFEHMDFSEISAIMQVNVLSLMRLTQTLLPLLKSGGGRIVNISSISGHGAMPFLTVYAASKFAVEGFSEGLRRELKVYGIPVIVVGPGSIRTPIWEKGFQSVRDRYSRTAYAEPFARFMKIAAYEGQNGLEPQAVSRDVRHALTADRPRLSYNPVPRKWTNWYLPMLTPMRLRDWLIARVLGLRQLPGGSSGQ